MEDVALIVLGSVIGALATGGVAGWDAWRQRVLRRKVAARMVLGDLFVVEAVAELVVRHHRWTDRDPQFHAAVQTWRESREAFAAGVEAWEWALVDGLFSDLNRTAPMARLGQPTTPDDENVLDGLSKRIPRVRKIVLGHAAPSQRERSRLVQELSGRDATSES